MNLSDEMLLGYKKLKECEVEIVDNFASHSKINEVFKTKSCEALRDTVKFFCH